MKVLLTSILFFLFISTRIYGYSHPKFKYPHKQKLTINSERLGLCFYLLARSYKKSNHLHKSNMRCRPFYSSPYSTRNNCGLKNNESHFRDYLAAFPSRAADFTTGKEENLKKWILNQPDNSISPFSIFKKSLEMHNGNLWNSILAIHDLFRNQVRWYKKEFYSYESSYAKESNFINKFIDIRGDLLENNSMGIGDHGGSWYRIWAAMLERLMRQNNDKLYVDNFGIDVRNQISCSLKATSGIKPMQTLVWFFHNMKSYLTSTGVEIYGALMGGQPDKRKMEINIKGTSVANSILKYFRQGDQKFLSPNINLKLCESPDTYIENYEDSILF